MKHLITRRQFLMSTALAAGSAALGGCATRSTVVRAVPRRVSPNEKLNIGIIGCGGKGASDAAGVAGENIIALCDVDEIVLNRAAKKYPGAKLYRDFRRMLDEVKTLDAVTISTPDHQHAPAAMRAITRGLHVYVQKPLTHNIWEARQLTEAARRHRVATQMGNQGTSSEEIRRLVEMIQADAIGHVREVHLWTNRPIWPQGKDRPPGSDPVPAHLDWDLWLGPAPVRPFKDKYPDEKRHVYHPFCWRGWWDFGTGALGDIACHTMNAPMWALKLGAPVSVEVVDAAEVKKESFPSWSIIRWDFAARGNLPPVKLFWYDGGQCPPTPPEMEDRHFNKEHGALYIGDKGKIYAGRLLPESRMKEFTPPPATIPRIPGGDHYQDWLIACKGGRPACSSFDFAGPLTELVLLGNIALRLGRKIGWDARRLRVPHCSEAGQHIRRAYRKGWEPA
ncbi:MAG: Gfo/Idh/MocA family oxidoreductase [Verrucomicrobia bacterium]|nr:Gfo/Idh/MocA family oxidoreductase [Verrucomicrobiota bacterium]